MRQIKFRAWDKLREQFTRCDEGYQGHYALSLKGEFYNLQNGSGGKEYVVQQYTGLLDKNGKEIYEGDILIFRPLYDESLGRQFGNAVFSVSFKDGSFRFGDEFADQDGANYYEIIGNIFENNKPLENMNNDEIKDKLESLKYHHVYIATTDQEVYLKDALDIITEEFADKGNLCDQTTLDLVEALRNLLK